ncbi:hypothetical protein [Nesterenkonia lutea]|uniref:Uncharacterized protein n=1 Tax=Nesterenkonia lutea TaxID=272919 RepID=A0ABR9JFD9_9MICC|nr:hypothetical protein [Nesterenkonia lutea]MBE1524647.1 hypothetical protein [Nesterenkonia lutea]
MAESTAQPDVPADPGRRHEEVLAPEAPDAGPLPQALESRAEAVLESLAQASARARAARHDVGRQLNALRQVPPRDSGEARYLDTSG